jgi:hypothetical protein
MIGIEELKEIYIEKLIKTGSMDAAFTKVVWIAYLKGIEEAHKELYKNEDNQ